MANIAIVAIRTIAINASVVVQQAISALYAIRTIIIRIQITMAEHVTSVIINTVFTVDVITKAIF